MNNKETFTLSDVYPGNDIETIKFRSTIGRAVKKRYLTKSKGKRPELVSETQNKSKITVCSYPRFINDFDFFQHVKETWSNA